MATLTVGAGEQYSTISAAVAAASSGDTVDVDAGTYTNDFPSIFQSLTLQAVGGTVDMVAAVEPPNGKGIIDEGGPGVSVTINGFDISGAQDPDSNGAGIRYEGGSLTLDNDNLHNNQDGLLSNADPNGTITINGSTFTDNGAGDGESHNIYIGDIASFTLQNSTSSSANVGHEVKSRAQSNTITNNLIEDGPNGNSSYEIDFPNGGNDLVANNVIEKGPDAQNPTAITFGEEGGVYANSNLTVQNNIIVNDDPAGDTNAVVNDTSSTVTITGNQLFGWTTVVSGPAELSGNTVSGSTVTLGGLNGSTAASDPPASGTATPATDQTPSTSTTTPANIAAAVPASTVAAAGSMPVTATTVGSSSATPSFVAGSSSDTEAAASSSGAGSAALATPAMGGDPSAASLAQTPATPLDPAGSASGSTAAITQASGPGGGHYLGSDLPSGSSGTPALLGLSSQHTVPSLFPT